MAEHFARGAPAASVETLFAGLAEGDKPGAAAVIGGLEKGWPRDAQVVLNSAGQRVLAKLLGDLPPSGQGQLIRLVSRWGSEGLQDYINEIGKSMMATVTDPAQLDSVRVDAARQLVQLGGANAETVDKLLALVTPRTAPDLAIGIIEALGLSQGAATGEAFVQRISGWTPAVKSAAVKVLLSRPELTTTLLDGLDEGQIRLGELSLDQKQALARYPDRKLAARATKLLARGGDLPNADRQAVLDQLLPLTRETGDAKAGHLVFTKQCSKCHRHSGEGNQIGPDLTGMAVHPKSELLTHIIDPSRSVEGNFRIYSVVTNEGRVLDGQLASETKTAIELIDTEGKRHTVLREDVDELVGLNKSLMPDGFEKQVPRQAIVDLLEFLTQRGKFLPLDLGKVATVVSTQGMFYSLDASVERLIFADWSPKTVDGVPFVLVDPQVDRVRNAILLYGPNGKIPPRMPKSVRLPCNSTAAAVHLLSGVSGWGFKNGNPSKSVSMIVRLHYEDGKSEDHPLLDGVHFADYIGVYNVPESKLAFKLRGQQIRYLAIRPKRQETIREIELVKGPDGTAPIVMAVTVEAPSDTAPKAGAASESTPKTKEKEN